MAFQTFGFEREVDHHDGVLLHDADQQHDADDAHDVEIHPEQIEPDQCTDGGRRQGGEDRDRVDIALIENAQHDIDRDHGRHDQPDFVGQRRAERRGRALEGGLELRRQADLLFHAFDGVGRGAQRIAIGHVERDGRGGNCP